MTGSHDPSAIAGAVNAYFAEHEVASLLVRSDDAQVLTLDAEGVSRDGRVLRVAIRRWRWTEYGGHNEHDEVVGPGVVEFHAPFQR